MGFSRQENWSGLSFPSPGDLPDPEIPTFSLALAGRFFTTVPSGKYEYVLSIKQGIPIADSLEKTLMLGKIEAKGEEGGRG